MRAILALLVAFAGLAAMPARAEWLEATTRHFVLYANTGEGALRRQAVALERMDWGLRRFMGVADPPDAASNKLTVFVTGVAEVQKLCGCPNVAGFYVARVSGSVAFSGLGAGDASDQGRIVLFHEYAHHFLLGTYQVTFPVWYTEGFAEFASTTTATDDRLTIGAAAQHRAWGLLRGQRLSAAEMFDPATWGKLRREGFDAFYGRGWLLTHYLTFNQARFAQFREYVTAINRGVPGMEAARAAFGDLKVLDRELSAYLAKSSLPAMVVRPTDMPSPPVTIRRLGGGEAALIRLRMESVRGVNRDTAAPLYARAAPLAAKFPDDAIAQGWLAEMAYDAGQNAAAERAADRAVQLDPKSVQGLLYKGRLGLRALAERKERDPAAWTVARKPIIAANRLDPDDAEPLWLFWESFAIEGREPVASAKTGLYRAQELVPQDEGVRFAAATSRIIAKENDEAKRLLRPLAFNPHAPADNPAVRMLAALDAGKSGQAVLAAGAEPAKPAGAEEAKPAAE